MRNDLFTAFSKDINIVFLNQIGNLHIGTVPGSQRQRTVQHKLHVSCPAGFLACQ